jgi:hypothetical protein
MKAWNTLIWLKIGNSDMLWQRTLGFLERSVTSRVVVLISASQEVPCTIHLVQSEQFAFIFHFYDPVTVNYTANE